MLERLQPVWRNLALGLLGALCLWFAWEIRSVLNPLLLGYLCAYVLHPLVLKLERRGMSRRAAVNLIFLLGFVLLVVISIALWRQGQNLVREVVEDESLAARMRAQFDHAKVEIEGFVKRFMPDFTLPDWPAVQAWAQQFLENFSGDSATAGAGLAAAGGAGAWLISFFGSLLALLGLLLLVPLYSYFLLFQLGRIHDFVAGYLPHREKQRILRVAGQIGEMLASFFRGRLLVCLLKGIFLTIGMWIGGLPYALLFGLGSGFLGLIPFFGAFLGFLGALLVGTLEHGLLDALLRTGIIFGLAEILEGYVLLPKILGQSLGLHPIIVLFALMAGAVSLGFFGMLIALPLTATIVILVREFVLPALKRMAEGDDRAPG